MFPASRLNETLVFFAAIPQHIRRKARKAHTTPTCEASSMMAMLKVWPANKADPAPLHVVNSNWARLIALSVYDLL